MTEAQLQKGKRLSVVISDLKKAIMKLDNINLDNTAFCIDLYIPKDKDVVSCIYNALKTSLLAKQKDFENL